MAGHGVGQIPVNQEHDDIRGGTGWGFIRSFGNKVKWMPEADHLGEMTWSSIRSTNCFRFQGSWLLSQTLPAECKVA